MESPRFSKARFSLQSEQIVAEKRAFLSGHATVCEFGVTTIFGEALLEELKAQVVAAESGHFGFFGWQQNSISGELVANLDISKNF